MLHRLLVILGGALMMDLVVHSQVAITAAPHGDAAFGRMLRNNIVVDQEVPPQSYEVKLTTKLY